MLKYYRIVRSRLSTAYHKLSLVEILTSSSEDLSLRDRSIWIKRLIEWIGTPIASSEANLSNNAQNIRLKLLIKTLSENPFFAKKVSVLLTQSALEVDPLSFFCDAGTIESSGFFKELLDRLALRYLPSYKNFADLAILTEFVFDGENDSVWIEGIDSQLLIDLWTVLNIDTNVSQKIKNNFSFAITHSCKILASRLASLSAVPEFRIRVNPADRYLLIDLTESQSEHILQSSFRVMNNVYQSLEGTGVSIELVFLLERMKGFLARLQLIHNSLSKESSVKSNLALLCQIISDQDQKNSIFGFLSKNLNLLSKKITDRAGKTGEHYIARSPKEVRALFWSSAGGGVLTTFTTLLKSGINSLGLPLFIEGFMTWVNYSLSFMLIQVSHFTLATKTPAMTAPVLAEKLKEVRSTEKQIEFIKEVKVLFRSGFFAILGNVIFVSISAIVIDLIMFQITDNHMFSQESGIKHLKSHHLITSLTLWYAIYTGGALWLGSAIGGWFENWFTYRQIPLAIRDSYFLQAIFGKLKTLMLSEWMARNIMGIATNIALGFLLAFSSIFGKFFGLPIDVRHVTLSSGTLAFSVMSIEDFTEHRLLIGFALVSIIFIGALNFLSSFLISLFVAAQARDIRLSQYPKLFRYKRSN